MAFHIRPELREEIQAFVLPFPTNDKSPGEGLLLGGKDKELLAKGNFC